jgi:uncharacterized protein (UPF0147 family)
MSEHEIIKRLELIQEMVLEVYKAVVAIASQTYMTQQEVDQVTQRLKDHAARLEAIANDPNVPS